MKLRGRKVSSPSNEGQKVRATGANTKTYSPVGLRIVPDPDGSLEVPNEISEYLIHAAIPIISSSWPVWSRADALALLGLFDSTLAVTFVGRVQVVGRGTDDGNCIWHAERRRGERWDVFAERSCDEAKACLEKQADAAEEMAFYYLDFSTETTYISPCRVDTPRVLPAERIKRPQMTRLGVVGGHFVPDPYGNASLPVQLPDDLVARALPQVDCFRISWSQSDALAVVASMAGSSTAICGIDINCGMCESYYETLVWHERRDEAWAAYADESHRRAAAALDQYSDAMAARYALACQGSVILVLFFRTAP